MAMYPPARGPQETFNPYAAPSAAVGPEVDEFGYPALRFGVSEVIARAWAIYQSRMGFCIGVVVGWYAIYFVAFIALGAVTAAIPAAVSDPSVAILASAGMSLGFMLFAVWFSIGLNIVMLKLARGRLASFGDLFSGAPFVLTSILAGLVLGLVALGAMIALMVPMALVIPLFVHDAPSARAMGSIVGGAGAILVICMLSLRLSQFAFAMVDLRLGAMESIKVSFRATSGKVLSLLLIFLIVGLINFLGAILLGVGLIFTIPLSLLILAVTYTALVPAPRSSTSTGVNTGWRKPEAPLDF